MTIQPEAEQGYVTLAVNGCPPEAFRRLLPIHLTVCRIEGGLIWAAWGLN